MDFRKTGQVTSPTFTEQDVNNQIDNDEQTIQNDVNKFSISKKQISANDFIEY